MSLKRKRFTSLAAWRDAQRPRMNQRAAAAKFGITQPYWHLLETGQRTPRPWLAQKLSAETGVPLERLLGIAS